MSKGKWLNIALPDAYFSSRGLLFPPGSDPAWDQPNRAVRTRMLRDVGGGSRGLPLSL
jgi:hypothetical protein